MNMFIYNNFISIYMIFKVTINSVVVNCISNSSVGSTLASGARELASLWPQKDFRCVEHVPHKTCAVNCNTSTCVKSTHSCVFRISRKYCVLEIQTRVFLEYYNAWKHQSEVMRNTKRSLARLQAGGKE